MFFDENADEMMSSFNHILEYRYYEGLFLAENPDFNGPIGMDDLKKEIKYLDGNVAVCSLFKNGKLVANGFMAGSIYSSDILKGIQLDSYFDGSTIKSKMVQIIGSGDVEEDVPYRYKYDDLIYVTLPYPEPTTYYVKPTHRGKENRLHDSERLLINVCQQLIDDFPEMFDTVLLVTERIPCKSCTQIIIDFATKNKINIKLAYWIDTGNDEALRDLDVFKRQIKKNKNALKYFEVCHILCLENDKLHCLKCDLS